MAAYTSSQAGNWSSASTWGGSGPPGAGDTATINHAVTVTADTTIGAGTATTCLTVATTSSSLTVTGAKLTIRGHGAIGAYNGGTIGDYIVLNPSGATQGGIEFDGDSGVTPVVTTGYDCRCVANGTSSGHCYVRTKSGSAGGNAYFTNAGNSRSGFWYAAYTDFTRLGSSSQSGLYSANVAGGELFGTNASHYTAHFDRCVIDSCGRTPDLTLEGSTDGSGLWSFTNCTWQNSLASASTGCMGVNTSPYAVSGSGTRLIDSCVFLGRPYFSAPRDFTITNSYFHDGLFTAASANVWASFDGNLYRNNANDGAELQSAGGWSNNYLYGGAANTGVLHMTLMSQYGGSMLGNVCEYAGSGAGAGTDFFGETEGSPPSSDRTYTLKYNVAFNSGSGGMVLLSPNSNTGNSYENFTVYEHNTLVAPSVSGMEGASSIGIKANAISSIKANIFRNAGTSAGTYAFKDTDTTPTLDSLPAANADYNVVSGYATVTGTPFSGVTGDTNMELGTYYYAPMSGASRPGQHDVTTAPTFADATRNLATWSTSKGGPGTVADAISRLQADPSLTKTDLIPWVRAGYRPTNAAFRGASFPGDTSTADAAGNAWAGGATPDVGAMAVQASDPVFPSLTFMSMP